MSQSESSQSDKESSATPRTDAIAATHDEAAAWVERTAGYNELLEHARDLEREIDQWRAISKEASRVAPSAGVAINAAILEQHKEAAGHNFQWPVDTVGKLIASLQTLPPQMPFHTAYFVDIGGKREARIIGPSLSRETIDGFRIAKFDPEAQSLVMWASTPPSAREASVTIPLETARLVRKACLPANPNKCRGWHPDLLAAVRAYIAAVDAAVGPTAEDGERG